MHFYLFCPFIQTSYNFSAPAIHHLFNHSNLQNKYLLLLYNWFNKLTLVKMYYSLFHAFALCPLPTLQTWFQCYEIPTVWWSPCPDTLFLYTNGEININMDINIKHFLSSFLAHDKTENKKWTHPVFRWLQTWAVVMYSVV